MSAACHGRGGAVSAAGHATMLDVIRDCQAQPFPQSTVADFCTTVVQGSLESLLPDVPWFGLPDSQSGLAISVAVLKSDLVFGRLGFL